MALGEGEPGLAAVARACGRAWCCGAGNPGRAGSHPAASLLAAGYPRLLCANCLWRGVGNCGVHEQMVGFRAAAIGGQWKSFNSFADEFECWGRLPTGDSRVVLAPPRTVVLARPT